jgi:NAD(P)-dependent dehydrogenase (short-subunit alcohol dehydrogenase family)
VRVLVTGVSEGIGGAICRQIAGVPDSPVAFLIDRDNHYVTGENVMVDGGLTLSVLDRIPGVAHRNADVLPTEATGG